MSASPSMNFTVLLKDLRTMIWLPAIVIQVQDHTDSLPRWFTSLWAERRRLVFVGHDNLPSKKTRLPVRVRFRDPYNECKMRLEEDDFETLVSCLSISAVLREAHAHTAEFRRTPTPRMEFK